MSKSFFISSLFVILLSSSVLLAQGSESIQINGGVIYPQSSTYGFTTAIQFNFNQNSLINFYTFLGYGSWDRFFANFTEEWSSIQKQTRFKTYISDEHILIPIYIGSKINFHTNKYFTSFVNVEVGYSYLQFNSYDYWRSINPETGEVVGYYPDATTKEEIEDNLIGLGIGLGISHPMGRNMHIIFSAKLNSNIYAKYADMFNSRETYMSYLVGFGFDI